MKNTQNQKKSCFQMWELRNLQKHQDWLQTLPHESFLGFEKGFRPSFFRRCSF